MLKGISLSYQGLGELLHNAGMQTAVSNKAREIQGRCGSGYRSASFRLGNHVIGRVSAVSYKAKKDNLKNNTLLKEMH